MNVNNDISPRRQTTPWPEPAPYWEYPGVPGSSPETGVVAGGGLGSGPSRAEEPLATDFIHEGKLIRMQAALWYRLKWGKWDVNLQKWGCDWCGGQAVGLLIRPQFYRCCECGHRYDLAELDAQRDRRALGEAAANLSADIDDHVLGLALR